MKCIPKNCFFKKSIPRKQEMNCKEIEIKTKHN